MLFDEVLVSAGLQEQSCSCLAGPIGLRAVPVAAEQAASRLGEKIDPDPWADATLVLGRDGDEIPDRHAAVDFKAAGIPCRRAAQPCDRDPVEIGAWVPTVAGGSVWERSPLVQLVRRNLDYPHNWPDEPAREKGIDVAIAVDMIHLAMTDQMDVAILFSSDKDLLPAVEVLFKQRLCHVEVAAWEKGNRLRFDGQQLPWCHSLNEAAFESVRDTTDYAAPVEPFPSILRPKFDRP